MDKSPDAFRTISEVAESLDTPAHVLRFWESRFPQIKPVKRAGGRRYYRPADVALLTGIKRLLHDEGLTIRGVQKILRDQGVRLVAGLTDDSVTVDTVLGAASAANGPPVEAQEASFIAVEDEDEAEPEVWAGPAQQVFPSPPPSIQPSLFDASPNLTRAEAVKPVARKPSLPDNVTFSSLIRQLPQKAILKHPAQLAEVLRRLRALRVLMSERAEGGTR